MDQKVEKVRFYALQREINHRLIISIKTFNDLSNFLANGEIQHNFALTDLKGPITMIISILSSLSKCENESDERSKIASVSEVVINVGSLRVEFYRVIKSFTVFTCDKTGILNPVPTFHPSSITKTGFKTNLLHLRLKRDFICQVF